MFEIVKTDDPIFKVEIDYFGESLFDLFLSTVPVDHGKEVIAYSVLAEVLLNQ